MNVYHLVNESLIRKKITTDFCIVEDAHRIRQRNEVEDI